MIRLLSFFANGFYRKISCFLCSEVRASSFVVIYNAALSRIRFSVASVCVKNMRFCYHQKPIGREPYAGDNGTNYQKTAERTYAYAGSACRAARRHIPGRFTVERCGRHARCLADCAAGKCLRRANRRFVRNGRARWRGGSAGYDQKCVCPHRRSRNNRKSA